MRIEKFEDVIAWQKARSLNRELFKEFTNNKNFTFRDQILRASLSITNNIAEGFERRSNKELRQFLVIARGSTGEVRSMLHTALDNNYITQNRYQELLALVLETGRLLTGFIKTLSQRNSEARKATTAQ